VPTATPTAATVSLTRLADGIIVQLQGEVSTAVLPQLRRALLMPMPTNCRDVILDAGAVTGIDDAALAALLAARDWAGAAGRRFSAVRISPQLAAVLEELALPEALALLAPITPPPDAVPAGSTAGG
jgi:anti-anti-sigma regulatory factor